jgi:hypothetical protein
MRIAAVLLTASAALLAGCGPSATEPVSSPVRIETMPTVIVPSAETSVPFSLTNVTKSVVMIQMCGDAVSAATEVRQGTRWDEGSRRGLACPTDRYNGTMPLSPGERWTGSAPTAEFGTLRVLVIADGEIRASPTLQLRPLSID